VSLPGEALVAVTGLFPEKPLLARDGEAARKLPGEWRGMVKDFFDQGKPRKFRLYKRPDHDAMLTKLTEAESPQGLVGKLADAGVADDYLAVLSNCREYVRARWPALSTDTFTGPRMMAPGFTAMGDAWMIFAVVDDPTCLLTEVLSGTVQAPQVDAVTACYPELWKMLQALIQERKQLEQAAKKSWAVGWAKERVLRILFSLPADVPIKQAQQPPARTGGASRAINIDFKSSQTLAQRIEAK